MTATTDTIAFERALNELYARSADLARRYYFTFRHPGVRLQGVPTVLFLGNHSSGKSSMINWILGDASVQDTGVAPTDDGFTVILYGETEEDVNGPAALAKLPPEFQGLESFGSSFLQRLRVKLRKRDCLKNVCLVDSPGMIDAAEGTVSRDYDFAGAVRRFAELCDMVFFLFDPEKPGTTGETVTVFAQCLHGLEFKLRVLLNKCDAFSSTFDFARAYGTLCWNLARVLGTKDLPKIYTTYSGAARTPTNGIDCADFDRQRREVLDILDNASARRLDNVFASAQYDLNALAIRMRVLNAVSRIRVKYCCATVSVVVLLALIVELIICGVFAQGSPRGAAAQRAACGFLAVNILCIPLAVGLVFGAYAVLCRLCRRLSEKVDDIFAEVYHDELVVGSHDDRQQLWQTIREETAAIVARAPFFGLPIFGEWRRRRLEKATDKVFRIGRSK